MYNFFRIPRLGALLGGALFLSWFFAGCGRKAALPSPAPSGDSFNNGGGYSEQLIAYAWVSLEKSFSACLASRACNAESGRLALAGLTHEKGGIKFLSPAALQAIPGRVTLKKGVSSSRQAGAAIYFDADVLESSEASAAKRWTLPRANEVLAVAVLYHTGRDLERCEALGAELSRFSARRQETLSLTPLGLSGVEVVAVQIGSREVQTDLLLSESGGLSNLRDFFMARFRCPGSQDPPSGVSFSRLEADQIDGEKEEIRLSARSSRFQCADHLWRGEIQFRLKFQALGPERWQWVTPGSRVLGTGLWQEN